MVQTHRTSLNPLFVRGTWCWIWQRLLNRPWRWNVLCKGTNWRWHRTAVALTVQPDSLVEVSCHDDSRALLVSECTSSAQSFYSPFLRIEFRSNFKVRYVDTSNADAIEHLPYRVLPPGTVKMLWVQSGMKCSWLDLYSLWVLPTRCLDFYPAMIEVCSLLETVEDQMEQSHGLCSDQRSACLRRLFTVQDRI